MNATPLLNQIARLLKKHKLDVVLIGNAAAALHGAPVTTIDVDFMFRDTPSNLVKLKALAKSFDAVILRPYYPASNLYRIQRDADGLQLDLMPRIHGITSFASLKSRATPIKFGGHELLVASLEDIIKSKKVANRSKDALVLDILQSTLQEIQRAKKDKE